MGERRSLASSCRVRKVLPTISVLFNFNLKTELQTIAVYMQYERLVREITYILGATNHTRWLSGAIYHSLLVAQFIQQATREVLIDRLQREPLDQEKRACIGNHSIIIVCAWLTGASKEASTSFPSQSNKC